MNSPESYEKEPSPQLEDTNTETTPNTTIKREIVSWIKCIVAAIIAVFILQNFVLINATIPTGSMISTMNIKDRVFAFRLSYLFSDPERGDIIVFKNPSDTKQKITKRIIGLPGDTLQITDGKVYLNGSDTPLDEPYLHEEMFGSFGPYEVPENSYFMMGDNRNNSHDSRAWENPYLNREFILGKIIFKYYPKFELLTD